MNIHRQLRKHHKRGKTVSIKTEERRGNTHTNTFTNNQDLLKEIAKQRGKVT